MTVNLSVKVTGLSELSGKLADIQAGLADGQLVGKVAAIVQGQAQKNALSGHGKHSGGYPNAPTGTMASSIATQVTSLTTAVVGPRVYYAQYVEFGHRQTPGRFVRALGKRLVSDVVKPYPFMRPVIGQTKEKIKTFVVNYIKKLVRK